jgi:flagellar biosynthesis protein FliR
MFDDLPISIIAYVLVLFRVAGMMVFAPLFGSARIPRRVRSLLAIALAVGIAPGVTVPTNLPQSTGMLAAGIAGEIAFGIAMGMVLNFVFFAAQWAGEIIGQQMGLNLSESFDPQFGHQGSATGEMYLMFTLVVFLCVRGHHAMLKGVAESFRSLPLLSVGVDGKVLDTLLGLLQSCTTLAIQLAAPVLVSMLIVDLALGFLSKTIPQLNVMSAGLTLRSLMGMVVVIFGIFMTSGVLRQAMLDSMQTIRMGWRTGLQ